MTQSDWLNATEPQTMLAFLKESGKATDRKLRLFACGCCRRLWEAMTDERSRKAVEVAEQYADGLVRRELLILARDQARAAKRCFLPPAHEVASRAANAAFDTTRDPGRSAAENCSAEASRAANAQDTNHCNLAEMEVQAALLRDIFGSPHRLLRPLAPSLLGWQNGLLRQLAQAAYEHHLLPSGHFDPAPVAILTDGLIDAGYEDGVLIGHLREAGPHYRGCVAVDAV